MDMARHEMVVMLALLVILPSVLTPTTAELSRNYYANICPDVESIVRNVVTMKLRQTNDTIPATIRLFFHDCIVQGCDASVIIRSTPTNKAEKDHPENLSLAGDGFDTVIKAKAAVDAIAQCRNKVSCADILAIATRDVIELTGGPSYAVELGRLDGLSSMASSVTGKLPSPDFNLDELTSFFSSRGLTMVDMIALSAAHTVGFSHCKRFASRIYNYSASSPVDPLLNPKYAKELLLACPRVVDPRVSVLLDPVTPVTFDNQYFKNLQQGMGLLTSDQVLFTDPRSHPHVDLWAQDSTAFSRAFVEAITKLGRVGVKVGSQGNVRRDCAVFN